MVALAVSSFVADRLPRVEAKWLLYETALPPGRRAPLLLREWDDMGSVFSFSDLLR